MNGSANGSTKRRRPGAPVGLERPHERHGLGGEAGPVLHCDPSGDEKRERAFTLADARLPCTACRTGSSTRPAPTCASTPTTPSTGTRGARRRSPGPGPTTSRSCCRSGYSSCHWCHVMAHESFEDPDVAAVMNDRFVNVKVDREERPDVDAIYMQAVQAMTGSGGWPMTVFLDHDGRPFFGGTYFPPDDRPGHARASCGSWTRSTTRGTHRRDELDQQAEQLHAGDRARAPRSASRGPAARSRPPSSTRPSRTCTSSSTRASAASAARRSSRRR